MNVLSPEIAPGPQPDYRLEPLGGNGLYRLVMVWQPYEDLPVTDYVLATGEFDGLSAALRDMRVHDQEHLVAGRRCLWRDQFASWVQP